MTHNNKERGGSLPAQHPNSRGGSWGPKEPLEGQSQPSASWDPEGHWDIDDGLGNRKRYDKNGKPMTPAEAHGGDESGVNVPDDNGITKKVEE